MRFTFQNTHKSFWIRSFRLQNRQHVFRFVLVFTCSLFIIRTIHKYIAFVYIKIRLWATDIGIRSVHCIFLSINCEFAMCHVLEHNAQIYLFILCLFEQHAKFAGEFDMKIAPIHKLKIKWSTMLKCFLALSLSRGVLVFVAFHRRFN